MLSDHLNKVITRIKTRGFRAGVRYIRKRIYSTSKFYVLRNNMDKIPEITSEKFNEFQVIELTDPECALFHEIIRIWPQETKPCDIQYVTEFLRERSKNGAMCFVLLHKDKLIGANWLYPPNYYYLNFNIPFLPGEYVSTWTFIVSEYRGMGVSKFLKSYCLNMAKQRGIPSVISHILVKNTPSIRMNFSTGSQIIGMITERYRWFKYSHNYTPITPIKDKEQLKKFEGK